MSDTTSCPHKIAVMSERPAESDYLPRDPEDDMRAFSALHPVGGIVFTPTSATPTGDNEALLIVGYSTVHTTCVPLDFLLSSEIGAGAEVEALVRQFGWIECIDSREVRCAVCVSDANSSLPPGYTLANL